MVEATNFGEYDENEEMNDGEEGFGDDYDDEIGDAWDLAEEEYLTKKQSSIGAFELQGILNPSHAATL